MAVCGPSHWILFNLTTQLTEGMNELPICNFNWFAKRGSSVNHLLLYDIPQHETTRLLNIG